jgi:hypothetical protein
MRRKYVSDPGQPSWQPKLLAPRAARINVQKCTTVPILESHNGRKASMESWIDIDINRVVAAVRTDSFDQVM